MKRGLIFFLGAILLGAVGMIFFCSRPSGEIVRVYQAGQMIWENPLSQNDVFQTPHNTIRIEAGQVCVSQADCPDQICVQQGWISDGSVPIVCLPNQLIVQVEGGGTQLDAQTG